MKNLVLLIAALIMGAQGSRAESAVHRHFATAAYGYSNSFIFVENGISFSVYPDGEFDFYIQNQIGIPAGRNAALTFNAGFNYNPFIQYDAFGAVIQVRQVPVFYDFYGRVRQIGGMRVYYNSLGYYDYHVGYINPYNRYYVYQPFHRYFVRPATGFCMVYPQPYRRYYSPVRYTWYRPYRNNVRRAYARAGSTYRNHTRPDRSRIYRNDNRVTASHTGVRGNNRHSSGKEAVASRQSRTGPARTTARTATATERKGVSRAGNRTTYARSGARKSELSGTASTRTASNTRAVRNSGGGKKYTAERKSSYNQRSGMARAETKGRVSASRKSVIKNDRSGRTGRNASGARTGVSRRNPR